ncbi:efflux RND transporter periplasmic adaptor subunit [Alginatibacterium sediminis]|uniref:Efflux RND transporter periplasmic adaptor subunit n=1 Tax=Alginatibacterium sediminis TaxID=2164068 RepID=A0A420EL29_9ALTE|nr:efflux RND transporter periplasmic adaptor subunit [Alginatibacterium sediminis]RKF21407.1 efflux RND transporter periplasmic adaptor subunit [Alginatibacterium sediminis]
MNTALRIITLGMCTLNLSACMEQQDLNQSKTLRPVSVIEIDSNSSIQRHEYSGEFRSTDVTRLSFRVPGTITDIHVQSGEEVVEGQLLAELDPHDYQVLVNEIEARLIEAKSSHQLAKVEQKRLQKANANNAIAAVNLDRAKSAVARSAAGVQVIEQNLQKTLDALAYTKLYAPFDATVADVYSESFEQTLPGVPVMFLQANDSLEFVAQIPEAHRQHFEHGQSAKLTWFGQSQSQSAHVSEMTSSPDLLKQTYELSFSLPEQPESVLPGKMARVAVEIENSSLAGLVCLPHSAVSMNGDQAKVYKIDVNKVRSVMVEVPLIDSHKICVSGDVEQGDRLLAVGVDFVVEGQTIGQQQRYVWGAQ